MKAQAINHIRQHTEDGQDLSIQTIARYYYINETDGDQWELLEDSGLLAIYKGDETEYIDIDHIIAITANKNPPIKKPQQSKIGDKTMETQKVKITATDNIGRTESITLILPVNAAQRLIKAANNKDCYGQPDNYLRYELNRMEDDFSDGYGSSLSKSQYKRLQDFDTLIYHKFYNYTLTIE